MTHPARKKGRFAFILLESLLLGSLVGGNLGAFDEPPKYEPTGRYESRTIEGWTVVVNKRFLADQPELAERAFTLLRFQLYQVARRVPPKALEALRKVKIWVEEAEPHTPCTAYHPGAQWLQENGMNPDKARCIEISNVRNFLAWTFDQPWMVLHELAHAYHHQVVEKGFGNAEVKAAFDRATKARRYRSVLYVSGEEKKAYAATDPMEYFAEGTESFFGTNDFFPFVRTELKRHDPELFDLLVKLWDDTAPGGRP